MNKSYFRQHVIIPSLSIVFLAVLLLGLLTWGNIRFAQKMPGGGHFLVQWLGTRVFITGGIDPYSDVASQKIDTLSEIHLDEANSTSLRFVSPIYSVIFFLPFLAVPDFILARAIWMTFLQSALVLQVFLCIRMTGWKPGWTGLLSMFLFVLFGYQSLMSMLNGDLVILAGLCVVGGLLAMKSGGDELAGVLFAFATIKINMVYLFVIFMIFWGIRQKRWALVGWFFITIFLFSLSLTLLSPNWIVEYLRQGLAFLKENQYGTLADILGGVFPGSGGRIGWIISAVLLFVVMFEWWLARRGHFRSFLWTACLTLAANQWLTVRVDASNGIMLLPALVLVLGLWQERWRLIGKVSYWGSLLLLFFLPWVIFISQAALPPRQAGLLALVLPVFLLITLYWVRWWAVSPMNLWFDQISNSSLS